MGDADLAKLAKVFGYSQPLEGSAYAVIWTTTPWTIPANQALNVHPEFTCALVRSEGVYFILAEDLVDACLRRYKREGKVIATAKGAALEHLAFRHPLAAMGYDRA